MPANRNFIAVALVALLALAAGAASAQVTIDTTGCGITDVSPFGPPNTQTYGQVVTVPPDTGLLSSFGVQIRGGIVTFRWEVYAWDAVNGRATGSALYESGPVTTSGSATFEPYVCTIPGGLPVTPGNQYVLFASTSQEVQTDGATVWGYCNNDPYSGGSFAYINNGTDISQWTTQPWSVRPADDLAFTATFDPAPPVPALPGWALAVLAAAVAAVAVRSPQWRRRSL